MKCSRCGQDKSYWDMQPMPLTEEQKTYPITPTKKLVCHDCLGWEGTNRNRISKNLIIKRYGK